MRATIHFLSFFGVLCTNRKVLLAETCFCSQLYNISKNLLDKSLLNFVSPNVKLHNQYCHSLADTTGYHLSDTTKSRNNLQVSKALFTWSWTLKRFNGFRQVLAMIIFLDNMWTKLQYILHMYWPKMSHKFQKKYETILTTFQKLEF